MSHTKLSIFKIVKTYHRNRSSDAQSIMQGSIESMRHHGNTLKRAIKEYARAKNPVFRPYSFSYSNSGPSTEENVFVTTTIGDILKAKRKDGNVICHWCTTQDTVYDAINIMTKHNVGSLVVAKPDEYKSITGIITERDYLKKMILQGRSSKFTRVGDIMTDENKLITVTSDTSILQAMKLMTEKHIRHIPVIDAKMVGMVSIRDVVQAVVDEQSGELKRLNEFIQRGY
ncbi:CBS domain-containing protein CBSX3, mitochondrial [Amborella trichopoda]|uniref:CBS domain-containing protein CBSX3, mitochondrial n=1 Tax=Amborella trichopoda TaxID=13333 RepID=UPI0009BFC51F|nr:CBS domain-containing protein CBSX3, mitochondrial [Amborella trichopoda]|eukprot:XP_020524133.1 CBS domain-containing protein CBSX3, mitochondrial [Amborella trichopoda]